MVTIKELALKTGKSEKTIRWRANRLDLPKRYEGEPGRMYRVFTEDEAKMIIEFVGEKPGRKRK
jgi:hypothetical protein